MPSVSVIVPVYNVESYLCRCIDSILAQTFSDFELILVDDGSPDSCPFLCDQYEKQDKRIKVIHQNNSGVSAARNRGIFEARGEFIAFIDSDDWIAPTFLEQLYHSCVSTESPMAVCEVVIAETFEQNNDACGGKIQVHTPRNAIDYYGEKSLVDGKAEFRSPCAKLIRTDIVRKILFPLDRIYAEDAACVYLWMWNCKSVAEVKAPLYYYFQNPESVCHQRGGKHWKGDFLTKYEWISFFEKNHFDLLCALSKQSLIEDCAWLYRTKRSIDKKEARMYVHNLRMGLLKYGNSINVTFKTRPGLYNLAFPYSMKVIWTIGKIKGRVEEVLWFR